MTEYEHHMVFFWTHVSCLHKKNFHNYDVQMQLTSSSEGEP